ncbi:PH domain-containing protein [Sodalis sp. dw_96]|uniref:PH domain-containing protein n=1 Tax=Sodalis sp. dw_96 TaxID=2719794 RepID=UPI001BD6C7A7|nr:PH domain-containing protein [Sodalis sp. dw_96]
MINYKTATLEELKIEFKRLSKQAGDMPLGTRKEFYHLPAILENDETPLAVASGLMGSNTWLITLTDRRVLFLDKGMVFGLKQVTIDLADIVSVDCRTRMMTGSITLSTAGQDYTIENVMKGAVIPFTNLVNSARERLSDADGGLAASREYPVEPAPMEMIIQLEKLASLKERGILSDEEFSTQKARILAM